MHVDVMKDQHCRQTFKEDALSSLTLKGIKTVLSTLRGQPLLLKTQPLTLPQGDHNPSDVLAVHELESRQSRNLFDHVTGYKRDSLIAMYDASVNQVTRYILIIAIFYHLTCGGFVPEHPNKEDPKLQMHDTLLFNATLNTLPLELRSSDATCGTYIIARG